MNLSNKVEETIDKLKPHTENVPLNAQSDTVQKAESKFSFNVDELKDYVLIIICSGIAIAAIFLLIIPQYEQISAISTNSSATQSKLTELEKQSSYLKGLVGLKDELDSKTVVSTQALPATEDRVPYILDQLIQIAAKNNVEVDSLSLSGITDPKADSGSDLRTVQIQLSVIGDHEAIQNFFYGLETSRTLVDISTFQLDFQAPSKSTTAEGVELSAPVEKVNFSLRAYLKADSDKQVVDLSALANTPNYDALIKRLNGMDFYDSTPLNIDLGRDNPFGTTESTPSSAPAENTSTGTSEDDTSGIQ